jgi:hypothetical protein
MVGSPTGLTAKKWTGGADAWDFGLGLGGFGFNPGFRLHADYLWGLAQVISNPSDFTLDLYIGLGPVAGFGYGNGSCRNSFNPRYYEDCGDGWLFAGARLPLGIDLRLQKAPIELAVEIAPGAVVSANYFSGLFDASLIARYLF